MNTKKRGKNIICKVCGKSFYVEPNRFETAKYCSVKCQHISPDVRKKIAEKALGHKRNLGHIHSETTKKKMGKTRNRLYQEGKLFSEKTRQKMRERMTGSKLSKETKRRLKKNNAHYWKGKKRPPFTDEWKRKIREANLGEKNGMWKGGMSFEPYSLEWTNALKRSIRERDNYICQLTGQYGNTVHHIDYDKKNCDPKNLITLSISSNSKVNKNRKYWTKYFQGLIKLKYEY